MTDYDDDYFDVIEQALKTMDELLDSLESQAERSEE